METWLWESIESVQQQSKMENLNEWHNNFLSSYSDNLQMLRMLSLVEFFDSKVAATLMEIINSYALIWRKLAIKMVLKLITSRPWILKNVPSQSSDVPTFLKQGDTCPTLENF